jgi:hypothetical protein
MSEVRPNVGAILYEMYQLERKQGKALKQILVSKEAYKNRISDELGNSGLQFVPNDKLTGAEFKVEIHESRS